jgi:tetratricopeptide (TPR) repeat protein
MSARSTALLLGLLLLSVLLVYSNHFENSFHFDDWHTITNNPFVRSLANVPRFFTDANTFSTLPANRGYRPLLSTSLAFDYWLTGGYKPFVFHLSTFLWFLVQLVVMYFLFIAMLERMDPDPANHYVALFAVAWYGLHPVNAETLNYIIQRGDSLSTLGVVAGLWMFAASPGWRNYGLYLIPVALACLVKPPALVFPLILFAYLWMFEGRPQWLAMLPSIGLTIAMAWLQSAMTPKTFLPAIIPGASYRMAQPLAGFHYFGSFFLPLWLTADTDRPALDSLTVEALFGMIFVAALAGAIVFCWRKREWRPVAFGLLWFVIALLPTSLFTLSEVENDHRMFFPFVGLTLAIAWTIRKWLPPMPRRCLITAAVLLLAGYGYGTRQRNKVWRSEETLWHDVSIKSPRNGRGLMNYGLTLMGRGEYQGALDNFQQALIFNPVYPALEINLGVVNASLRRDGEAARHFKRAISLAPNDTQTHFYYARWLKERGRAAEALSELRIATALNASDLNSRYLLLQIYREQRDWSRVRTTAEDLLRLVPGDPAAVSSLVAASTGPTPEQLLDLSMEEYQAGRYAEAIACAKKALALRPGYPEAYNNLAAAHASMKKWDDAIQAAREAIRLKPDFQLARNNLAWAKQEKAAAQRHRP